MYLPTCYLTVRLKCDHPHLLSKESKVSLSLRMVEVVSAVCGFAFALPNRFILDVQQLQQVASLYKDTSRFKVDLLENDPPPNDPLRC